MDEDLAAYLDWPVSVSDFEVWCENGDKCPRPDCDGNGSFGIRSAYGLTPRELLTWIRKHAQGDHRA